MPHLYMLHLNPTALNLPIQAWLPLQKTLWYFLWHLLLRFSIMFATAFFSCDICYCIFILSPLVAKLCNYIFPMALCKFEGFTLNTHGVQQLKRNNTQDESYIKKPQMLQDSQYPIYIKCFFIICMHACIHMSVCGHIILFLPHHVCCSQYANFHLLQCCL